ncbi:hypothetical protein ACIQUS_09905 [Pseudomonas sp. NPDC090755]|uniref:hypothetical protein n=1 Tax=Pseudomonas sp. NPDC090755 TaxID=3364481 RepID=UPI00383ADF83
MSVTVIWNWPNSVRAPKRETIGNLLARSRHYRHPDSAQIAYPKTVEIPLGTLPNGSYRIAIVGAGTAGITALYELARLAGPTKHIVVDLFESDPDHFLAPAHPSTHSISTDRLRAGRVSAAHAFRSGETTASSVYEVGAMRFPEIAGLTWHYAAKAFGMETTVNEFPNPGKVPTEFVFGDRVDRYENGVWLDPASPTRAVFALVIKYFPGVDIDNGELTGAALFKIGGRDPAVVAGLLASENTPIPDLEQIGRDWQAFVASHDHTTLAGAIRQIMEHAGSKGELPNIPGLGAAETVNYCVELFGRFGFGTGGFKPLYNISLVEMMRLVLWDYSNEYTLPVAENSQFIRRLYEQSRDIGGPNLQINFIPGRVCDAYHHFPADSGSPRRAKVWHYPTDNSALIESEHDYVVLAMPQQQLTPVIRRSGFNPQGRVHTRVGDDHLGLPTASATQVYPALQLDLATRSATERIVSAIGQLHMTRSSKVFGLMSDVDANDPLIPRFQGRPIQAIVSDTGLSASYMVPSTLGNSDYLSFLVSYTWENETTVLQQDFGDYPQNPQSADDHASAHQMYRTMINRADHDVYDPQTDSYQRWWLSTLLPRTQAQSHFVYDWSTNGSAGGFKLDMTGDHYQSNLCFRYHTHAQNPSLNNRFFLACDSYSHLGGWIEGAFMSAINAVAGVIVAANSGQATSLNLEARKLFTTLDPVA